MGCSSLILILLMIFVGRSFFHQAPPSVDEVQAILHENWEDIQGIIDWLMSLKYEAIYISGEELRAGEAWADFSRIPHDAEILSRAQRLIDERGFQEISKDAEENTIAFYVWTDGIEADCGIRDWGYPNDISFCPPKKEMLAGT